MGDDGQGPGPGGGSGNQPKDPRGRWMSPVPGYLSPAEQQVRQVRDKLHRTYGADNVLEQVRLMPLNDRGRTYSNYVTVDFLVREPMTGRVFGVDAKTTTQAQRTGQHNNYQNITKNGAEVRSTNGWVVSGQRLGPTRIDYDTAARRGAMTPQVAAERGVQLRGVEPEKPPPARKIGKKLAARGSGVRGRATANVAAAGAAEVAVQAGHALNNHIIARDRRRKEPLIREARLQGRWVGVFHVYEVRNTKDVLAGIDPTIDEIAVGVQIKTGTTKEDVMVLGGAPKWGPAPRREEIVRSLPRGRDTRADLREVLPPLAPRSDAAFEGRYVIAAADAGARSANPLALSRELVVTKGNRASFLVRFRSMDSEYRGIQSYPLGRDEPGEHSYSLRFVRAVSYRKETDFLARQSPYEMLSRLQLIELPGGRVGIREQFQGGRHGRESGTVVWVKASSP